MASDTTTTGSSDDGRMMDERALRDAAIAIARAEHGDPFAVLGMHQSGPGQPIEVRAFVPGAERLWVIDSATGDAAGEAQPVLADGFFAVTLTDRTQRFRYRLRVQFPLATEEFDDAYRFGPVLGELDIHLLGEGTHLRAFERLGATRAPSTGFPASPSPFGRPTRGPSVWWAISTIGMAAACRCAAGACRACGTSSCRTPPPASVTNSRCAAPTAI